MQTPFTSETIKSHADFNLLTSANNKQMVADF